MPEKVLCTEDMEMKRISKDTSLESSNSKNRNINQQTHKYMI